MTFQMIDNLNDLFEDYKIKATCIDAFKHRHFSYYDVKLNRGAKLNSIKRNMNELHLAMQTRSPLIMDMIPEKGIVRLRTTHDKPTAITVDELYHKYGNTQPNGTLPFLLGETDEGRPLWVDMAKNPHLLIAGATGSGKSVVLQNIIDNATRRDDVMLSLVDTKLVEFGVYKNSVISNKIRYLSKSYDEAILALQRLELMMNKTYEYMAEHNIQSIEDEPHLFQKQIVIIDEAADLMMYDRKIKTFESLVVSLAQKGRSAGIYLVMATQRPSVDILTGLIKSNFPARLACRVSTKIDSRVILDQHGAENLAGRGDAILKLPTGESLRFQVGYSEPKQIISRLEKTFE